MLLNLEITVGDLITALSVLISASALVVSWWKSRRARQKESADQVRKNVGEEIYRLERWYEISLSLFFDVESIITEADMLLVETRDPVIVRDTLWKALVEAKADNMRLIVSENLETTSGELYAFGPSLRVAFEASFLGLKDLGHTTFQRLLALTQQVVLNKSGDQEHRSAQLGNALRRTSSELANQYAVAAREIIDSLKISIEGALSAKDSDLPNRLREVSAPQPLKVLESLLPRDEEENKRVALVSADSYPDLRGLNLSSPLIRPLISCRVTSMYSFWSHRPRINFSETTSRAPVFAAGISASKASLERLQRQKEKALQRCLDAKLKAANPAPAPDRKKRGR